MYTFKFNFSKKMKIGYIIVWQISIEMIPKIFWYIFHLMGDWHFFFTITHCTTLTAAFYCRNICLKGCSILSQWNVPLYFALVFANSYISPLQITGSVCKPDMPFSQLIGPVFPPLFPSRYNYPIITESASQGYVVLYHTELTIHFICFLPDYVVEEW